ncbi:MAG: hypothetical protein RI568_03430 [Natronomonas sp.]|uniref:hypothetical protein n=1 Tax=Natronomonas sp. TaxID=2184060 RepID=UPI00286FEA56|nr:hypothetical protein [Natronomonas sp.]MDR9429740.1 hypothetical protein [Natronomonas sp.]
MSRENRFQRASQAAKNNILSNYYHLGTSGVLAEGGEASVETPGSAPLQFRQAFEIRAEET